MEQATTPTVLPQTASAVPTVEAIAALLPAVDMRIRWQILFACCLAAAAKYLEPPIWVYNPPPDIPFEAAWNNYRLFASFAGLLTVGFLLAGGVLGDLYGRRRILLIGLSGYIAGNLMAMTLHDPSWHMVARSFAVAFGSFALPLSLAMLYITFQDRTATIAIAIFTTSNTLASQLAWAQGEYLARVIGWRAPYFLPTAVAVLAIIAILRVMPETMSGPRRLHDTIIYSGWTLIVLAAFFGLTGWPINDSHWWMIIGASLLVGGIGTGLVIWWQWRTRDHAKVRRSFRLHDLVALIITGVVLNFALIGYGVRLYSYFKLDPGFSDFWSLVAEAPILLGCIAGMLLFVKAVRKRQARVVIAAGLLVMAVAIVLTAMLPTGAPYIAYVLPMFIFGAGYLVAVTIWISAFFRTAVDGYYGLNAGINKGASLIGAVIGAAITGNLLTVFGMSYLQDHSAQHHLSPADLSNAVANFSQLMSANPADAQAVLAQTKASLMAIYLNAYAAAFGSVLYLVAALCAFSALVILWGLRRNVRAEVGRAVEEVEKEVVESAEAEHAA